MVSVVSVHVTVYEAAALAWRATCLRSQPFPLCSYNRARWTWVRPTPAHTWFGRCQWRPTGCHLIGCGAPLCAPAVSMWAWVARSSAATSASIATGAVGVAGCAVAWRRSSSTMVATSAVTWRPALTSSPALCRRGAGVAPTANAAGGRGLVGVGGGRWVATDATTTAAASGPVTSLNAPKGHPPGVTRLLERYDDIPMERIRCFSIIAHIDHGKSTLADKLLERTQNIWPTVKGAQQVLDSLEVERKRGITIKAQTASMVYVDPATGTEYLINLIDTPGHVDFSYEVSRSLAACQGALLLIDSGQGVQAQTVANHQTAVDAGLTILPVLTKIDLPSADPEPCLNAIEQVLKLNPDGALWTSAKTGAGIDEVLPAIIERVPPPQDLTARSKPLRCLLFDSWFDAYRGVVCSVLVVEGTLRPGDAIIASASGDKFTVQEVGLIAPARVPVGHVNEVVGHSHRSKPVRGLSAGHIGYMIAGMKSTKQAVVGDTFVHAAHVVPPLPGFRPAKPMVFASLYPVDSGDFNALITAVDRLTLNDASVSVERESSSSLGFGLRCGFLGLLHMDVFHQRLQTEFDTPVIVTAPMVRYRCLLLDGTEVLCERPSDFPPPHTMAKCYEPTVRVSIMTPSDFVSPLMGLLHDRRGVQEDLVYMTSGGGGGAGAHPRPTIFPPPAAAAGGAGANASGASETEHGGDDDDDDSGEEEEEEEEEEEGDVHTKPATVSPHTASSDRVILKYRVPWAEVVTNLYDNIKSMTAGYASLDWTPAEDQEADVVKVDLLLNGKPVDALSFVTHRDKAESEGRRVATKLKSVISRQQFEIVIQAAVGSKVLARERVPAFRKDVLIKSGKTVGGGDKSRKQKLLSKQKEGKKRMKTVGNVQLSQEAFHSIMMSGNK